MNHLIIIISRKKIKKMVCISGGKGFGCAWNHGVRQCISSIESFYITHNFPNIFYAFQRFTWVFSVWERFYVFSTNVRIRHRAPFASSMCQCLAFFSQFFFLRRIFGCSAVKVCVFPHSPLWFIPGWRISKLIMSTVYRNMYYMLWAMRVEKREEIADTACRLPDGLNIPLIFGRFVLSSRYTRYSNRNGRKTKYTRFTLAVV